MAEEEETPLFLLTLVIERGPRSGDTLRFLPTAPPIRIGRVVRGNSLPIKDPGISTKHLTIEFKSNSWVVTDLGSSNGTILNAAQVPALSSVVLRDGDLVKIGEVTVIRVGIGGSGGGDLGRKGNAGRKGKSGDDCEEIGKNDPKVSVGIGGLGGGDLGRVRRNPSRKGKLGDGCEGKLGDGCEGELGKEETEGPRGGTRREKAVEKSVGVSGEDTENGFGGEVVKKAAGAGTRGRGRGRPRREKAVEENVGSVVEDSETGFGAELGEKAVGVGTRGRGRPKRGKGGILIENVGPVEPVQGRNTRESKNEIGNSSVDEEVVGVAAEVFERKTRGRRGKEKVPDAADLGPVKVEPAPQVSTRRTRSARVVENAEKEDVDAHIGGVKMTEKGKKRNDNKEKLGSGEGICSEKGNVINVQSGDGLNSERVVVKTEPHESFCEEENVGRSEDLGIDKEERERRGESVKESSSKSLEAPDLAKMTLGDYFDYLEVSLPKQIIEETELIIADMHKKADMYREFVREHKKGKGTCK